MKKLVVKWMMGLFFVVMGTFGVLSLPSLAIATIIPDYIVSAYSYGMSDYHESHYPSPSLTASVFLSQGVAYSKIEGNSFSLINNNYDGGLTQSYAQMVLTTDVITELNTSFSYALSAGGLTNNEWTGVFAMIGHNGSYQTVFSVYDHHIIGQTGTQNLKFTLGIGDSLIIEARTHAQGSFNGQAGVTNLTYTDNPAPVPEPATMLLFGLGLMGIAGVRRKFSN